MFPTLDFSDQNRDSQSPVYVRTPTGGCTPFKTQEVWGAHKFAFSGRVQGQDQYWEMQCYRQSKQLEPGDSWWVPQKWGRVAGWECFSFNFLKSTFRDGLVSTATEKRKQVQVSGPRLGFQSAHAPLLGSACLKHFTVKGTPCEDGGQIPHADSRLRAAFPLAWQMPRKLRVKTVNFQGLSSTGHLNLHMHTAWLLLL